MNERALTAAAPDGDAQTGQTLRLLRDFPVVFLSYDEPWADANWRELRRHVPQAVRVHGVKGLDACHKAAANAVPGEFVVTVDADTRLLPGADALTVPRELLSDVLRLDWLSRNRVNGLWTGNGCLKLWPKRLLREMRTHEAAPEDSLSLDHGIGDVVPGRSGQMTLPGRASETDPARTEGHAFRAGFREAVFLRQMALEDASRRGQGDWREAGTARVLRIWCSVGRHAPNGAWVLYGARLGLLWHLVEPGWDPRRVNDYAWLNEFWRRHVRPRFGAAEQGCRWDWLEADLNELAGRLKTDLGFDVPEIGAEASQLIAERAPLSATAAASRHDALGYRMMIAATTPDALRAARSCFDVARWMDHPSAYRNIGVSLCLSPEPEARLPDAAWHFRAAHALGDPHAQDNLQTRAPEVPPDPDRPALRASDYPVVPCGAVRPPHRPGAPRHAFVADPGVTLGPGAARHVPDPSHCSGGRVVGYAARCEMTGRILPDSIRLAEAETPDRPADLSVPVVIGRRGPPVSAEDARDFAARDAAGIVPAEFAGAGLHEEHGQAYVDAVRKALSRAGALPGAPLEPDASRFLAAVLPAVSPPDQWRRACAGWAAADGGPERETAAALARTAAAVWGEQT